MDVCPAPTCAGAILHSLTRMERGILESWTLGTTQWCGVIRADNGDRVLLFYWSIVSGFRQLRVGQRVAFSRMVGLTGLERNVARLAVPVQADADSS